jgi:lysylphosphatidylglycerol synthetase-like protein (DUF2156 family)
VQQAERSPIVTERVRRFGGALSHALLDPSCRAFVMDGVDGVVAFQVIGNCAVELGDPICATAHKGALQDAFVAHCRERGWSTIAVATTEAKSEQRESGAVGFADLLFVDPRNDPATGRAGRHLRQNLARVRREGIRVDEYSGDHDEDLELRAQAACDRWRRGRGTSMFITDTRLFTERLGRRWFVARKGDDVIGVLSLLRADNVGGNLVNLVFADPSAPGHTTDLLVTSALHALRDEGAASVCFGIGPRREIAVDGFHRMSVALAKSVYRFGDRLVHFAAKTAYWEKFGPLERAPLFIRFEPPQLGVRECRALFRVFHFTL